MANILENIDVEHGKEVWKEINSNQRLADFHRSGYIAKYSWDDVYDVIAYERKLEMDPFISAMMAVNLVKRKIRYGYVTSGDVFSGALDDRLQDIYSELYMLFLRRIPAWDMSRGVYLDKFLAFDVDSCVRKTANFAVYGTGTGHDGPGVAISLQNIMSEDPEEVGSHKQPKLGKHTDAKGMILNRDGELFESSERRADTRPSAHLAAHIISTCHISPDEMRAIAFTHKFKVHLPPQMQYSATSAMKDYIATTVNIEQVV